MWCTKHTDSIVLDEMTKKQWQNAKKHFEKLKEMDPPTDHV